MVIFTIKCDISNLLSRAVKTYYLTTDFITVTHTETSIIVHTTLAAMKT